MISLKGFMEQTVTLLADESVENGAFVGMVDNEKVAKAARHPVKSAGSARR